MNKGHGRREKRTLTATPVLREYLEWPHARQVIQIQRERHLGEGRVEREVSYGVTSLPAEQADAARLLGLNRGHWGIENRVHGVRDETFGEDRCRVRSGAAPEVLAGLRNAAIHLLQGFHPRGWAAGLRRLAAKPLEAVGLIFQKVKL